MKEIVEKREVEELLGCEITDEQFEQALKYARPVSYTHLTLPTICSTERGRVTALVSR